MAMTARNASRRTIGFGSLGIVGLLISAALSAESTLVQETFLQTTERFGIFAGISVFLVGACVIGLYCIVRYVISTLTQVVDDNSLVMLRLVETMRTRPCLHDSDIEKLAEESSLGETGKRVLERRQARKARQ